MSDFTPAKTGQSRVFLIEGRARPDHIPSYESCLRAQALSKSFGDITKIECPDPNRYGKYIEKATIRGEDERPSITLEGRYALDLRSELLRLATKGCAADVQVHFGDCEDPSDFTDFKKILIIEDAQITTYDTEDLGSLQSGDEAAINESAEISGRLVYEYTPLGFSRKGEDVVTNEVIAVVFCDNVSCGECEDESDGCEKVYALTLAAGGSPGTSADIVYSLDGGLTWYAHDVDTLSAEEDPNDLACVDTYIVVVSEDSCSLHYATKDDFKAGTGDPEFTEVATGFSASGCPRAIWSTGRNAFVVGAGGYIYALADPTAGVTVLDAGSLVTSNYNDVHGLSDRFAVAVGDGGAVVFTENGELWQLSPTFPVGVGVNLNAVAVKSEREWWVGTSGGQLFYTLDAGTTWTEKAFTGSGSGVVRDIQIASESIMYVAHDTTAPRGRILASFDGGQEWTVLPQSAGNLPAADRYNALAVCDDDLGTIVAGGLADDGSDGEILVGQM